MPHHLQSEILDRLPPQDLDAERNVLGSIMVSPAVLDDVAAVLRPDAFYSDPHRRIYGAMVAMRDAAQGIDETLLVDRLRQSGELEAAGGIAYLLEISHAVPVSAHAAYYAGIVSRAAKLRGLIHAATDVLRDAYSATDAPEEILDRAEARFAGIDATDQATAPVDLASAASAAILRVQAIRARQRAAGLFTGLPHFDRAIGGLFGGELTILAARPGVGKTSLALQIAHYTAARGRPVYFASLEMSATELSTRLLCGAAGVSSTAIRANTLSDRDTQLLADAAVEVDGAPLWIHDRPGLTVNEIRRAARRMKRRGLELVVVDYLQRLTPDDRSIARHEQVGRMTDGLKSLARELDVPVLCLCQLNRAAEREDHPALHNLRESGSIEQDADMVLFIDRKVGSYAAGEDDREADLLVAKNRNGDTCVVRLHWNARRTRFDSVDSPRHDREF